MAAEGGRRGGRSPKAIRARSGIVPSVRLLRTPLHASLIENERGLTGECAVVVAWTPAEVLSFH